MSAVITGAKAVIKLSGEILAFATSVSVTHENRLEEIPQLDSLEVAEYAENGHRCSISINTIKLASNALIGGNPLSNSASYYGFDHPTDLRRILLQPELIIEIVEQIDIKDSNGNVTDIKEALVYLAEGCKFEGGTGQLDARGVWQGVWNFKCRRGTGI